MPVPDSDRYVAYAPVVLTSVFAVPFTVYGDPDDSSLLEVKHDGVVVDPVDYTFAGTTDHTVSPAQTTGGSVTFVTAVTGDVEIEGNRRPERISVFTEGVGVPARSHNAVLDALVATMREIWQRLRRAFVEIDALETQIISVGLGNGIDPATEAEAKAGSGVGWMSATLTRTAVKAQAVFEVTTLAALAVLTTPDEGESVFLREPGRQGFFEAINGDFSAEIAADPGQGIYVEHSTGAWVRVVDGYHSVKWWGATGDKTTDDSAAIQNAFDFCSFLTGTSTFSNASGLTLYFPFGEYLLSTGVTHQVDGLTLLGQSWRGSILFVNTASITALTIGDETYAGQTYAVGIENLGFRAGDGAAGGSVHNSVGTTAIAFHDVIHSRFNGLWISNFYQGIDGYRLNTAILENIFWNQNERNANPAAFALALKGRSTDGVTSGNNKISNFEIFGSATLAFEPAWQDGFLIQSADGCYIDLGHIYKCNYDVRIAPSNDNLGKTIAEIIFTNVYFDSPTINCLRMEGQTPAGGVYRHIETVACTFRGGNLAGGSVGFATNLVVVSVAGVGSGALREIILAGHFRQSSGVAVTVVGASSGKTSPVGFVLSGVFSENNQGGAATNSCFSGEIVSGQISGTFGVDANAATRPISVTLGASGSSVVIGPADCGQSNYTGLGAFSYTKAPDRKVTVIGVNGKGIGASEDHLYFLDATSTSATSIFTFTFAESHSLAIESAHLAVWLTTGEMAQWKWHGVIGRVSGAAPAWEGGAADLEWSNVPANLAAESPAWAITSNTLDLNVAGLISKASLRIRFQTN